MRDLTVSIIQDELDCLGMPLVNCKDRVMNATATLSREKLETFKQRFPAHLDADSFSIEVTR